MLKSAVINKDKTNNYIVMSINDKNIKLDIEQSYILTRLKNFSKDNFEYNNSNNLWYYNKYKTKERLIDILYSKELFSDFKFKNNDNNDYRKKNIELILDNKFKNIFNPPKDYEILEDGESQLIKEGSCAGEYRNMYWKVKDKNNNIYYIIHIKDDIYTKISINDINKVLNFKNIRPIWRLFNNGYVCCTININKKQKVYYLHQVIMDVHDEDLTNYERTVDHINQDKLDNRYENLRLTNMSIQNSNRDKVERRVDAIELPEGILQQDIPKYIVYRKEILDKNTQKFREYFYISNHPTFKEHWASSKSQKVNIKEKLKQAKLKIQEIDGIISTFQFNKETGNNNKIDLPTYISLGIPRGKYQLSFDAKLNNKRYNLKAVCKSSNIQDELNRFIILINKKYPDLQINNYNIKNPITLDESLISL